MIKDFRKIIVTTFLLLSMIIGVLIFLNFGLKTQVKSIEIQGGQNSANIENQTIRINFSHQLRNNEIDKLITIDPPIAFAIQKEKKSFVISFRENLLANTKYQLNIKKDNNTIFEDIKYEFTTKKLKLIYLEKSKDNEIVKVIESDPYFENKQILFEQENIRQFAKNKNYLAVLTLNSLRTNNIFIINLKDKTTKQLDIGGSLVSSISISPTKNELAFTSSQAIQRGSDITPSQKYPLSIYNIDKDETKIINPQNTAEYVLEAKYTNDGSGLVYQINTGVFYMTETQNYTNAITLGKHDAYGGFNKEKNQALFADLLSSTSKLVTTNINRQNKEITEEKDYTLDPIFTNNSNKIIFSQRKAEEDITKFMYELREISPEGKDSKIILSQTNKSLENAKVSPDDRYILIERYTGEKVLSPKDFRKIGFQLRPGVSELIVFDTKEQKIIDKSVVGVNGIWEVE